ncbi:hypothetical protein OUZ56_026261 [Daphnia magna]|uniref:Uncharacterized protein n=1 Tax=Daphnia magna TaxID=35525 RepID=A0ABQ9ZL96_9CRUS|nr:hypothetical protein OUZ56_026261 [Daphnia magna]
MEESRELRGQYSMLKNVTTNIMEKIADMEDLELSHFEYFFQLDETFEAMNQILLWLQQLADSLDVGFSLLANGHLAPQIIAPAKFNKVVKTINGQLLRGWSIPSDELWVAYRESTVSVAAMENSFRLFIYVPIFDHAQQYKLFQIINLPGSTDNGTHGVLFVNLPDYLAVSGDLETFLELSKDNIKDCSKIGHSLCKFHTGVSKRTARKSCAIAVFMNDTPRINTQCRKKFTEWRGPEVVYMGSNQWVYSATKPHEIVFSCPSGGEQQKLRTTTLPPVGMFEIPLGCTARTEEWVFPASMEGNIMAPKLQAVVLPTVEIFSQDVNITKNKKYTFVELPRENTSSIDIISQLLHRNAQASLSTEMTEEQIHNLITETKKQKETSSIRYPYELVSAISLIALGLIALAYKLYTLSVRLAVHERYDNPPPGDCGREELEMQEA